MTDKEKLEKLKKLADAMYYAAKYLTTDASRLHKAMDEYQQFIINEYHKEEPVSEELKEAADNALESISHQYDIISVGSCLEMFRLGAKWQKEEMMAKAIYAVVSQVPCANEIILRNPESVHWFYLPQEMNNLGVNKGDKVKLIIIKED